ncbi:MAG: 30S ribosomal protein S2 [Actinomycetia bacterium]|nr:30S ribosomal protein S2 [Actinomycetes bacterium]
MAAVSMKNLLEAGVHFGHQTRRWNPKMKPYIFTERNGIYILDLQRSLREIDATYRFVRDLSARGGFVLFIGTKKQAQEPVASEAQRASMPYVNQRWLGGMLTNFVTIRKRVSRMVELETMESNGLMASLPKKEALKLRSELEKLQKNLNGIRDMTGLPDAVFIIDTKREAIAIAEARRLKIPIIGLVDTNADPDEVDFVIPGNDDAIRAVGLICRIIADAAVDGRRAAGIAVEVPETAPEPVEEPAPVVETERAPEQPAVVDETEQPATDAE